MDVADCSGCEHKTKCLYKYNAEKKKYESPVEGQVLKTQTSLPILTLPSRK